jgi:hypothetical protein
MDDWKNIEPDLSAEPYVFAAAEPPPGVSPFALIREDEGPTLVLTRADVDQVGLAHDHLFVAWDERARAPAPAARTMTGRQSYDSSRTGRTSVLAIAASRWPARPARRGSCM